MLALAITVGFVAVVVGLIALVVRLSGRRFPGDITGDQGNPVNYDDYTVGWNIFGKPGGPVPPPGDDSPAARSADDDFRKWESEQRKHRE